MPSGVYPRKTPEERFWEKVDVRGPNDCWLWKSAVEPGTGYGAFWYRGRNIGAHRMSLLLDGRLPDPRDLPNRLLVTRHTCVASRLCVNPAHLLTGTQGDNNRDTLRQGRASVGERHHRCVLTSDQVRALREAYGTAPVTQLALQFGISNSQAHRIVHRESRKHE